MTYNGLDANNDLTHLAPALIADGYTFVGRYINPGKSQPLSHAEAKALSAAGLHVVSLWEQGYPNALAYFSPPRAHSDATSAMRAAHLLCQPGGTPVYFAVDYDATDHDTIQVASYFAIVHSVVTAAGYRVGVYGSGLVCQHLRALGWAAYTWLAHSSGWRDHADWLSQADIVQGPEMHVHGLDVDLDRSNGHAGGWQV